jgi:hypothetical protein
MPHASHNETVRNRAARPTEVVIGTVGLLALFGAAVVLTRPSTGKEMPPRPGTIAFTASPQQMLKAAQTLNSVDHYALRCTTADVRSTPVSWKLYPNDSFEVRVDTADAAGSGQGYDELEVSVDANGVSINQSAHGRPHHQTPIAIGLPLRATASPKIHYDAVNYTVVAGKTAGQGVMALMCDPSGVEQFTRPTLPWA